MPEKPPGAKIFDLALERQKREKKCGCEICILETQGFTRKRLREKRAELRKYLKRDLPDRNNLVVRRVYDRMANHQLDAIVRLVMNWDDGANTTAAYTFALLLLLNSKFTEAEAEHLKNNPPPPETV